MAILAKKAKKSDFRQIFSKLGEFWWYTHYAIKLDRQTLYLEKLWTKREKIGKIDFGAKIG